MDSNYSSILQQRVAIQDTEFNSEQACKEAIVKLNYIDSGWNGRQINMTCVNKGEEQ